MDRVWLVTGADSGFGRELSEAAVAAGDVVVATGCRPEAVDDLVAAHPDRVEAVHLDVTDPAGIDKVVDDVVGRRGRIDVLVNNAGRTHVGAIEETTDEELRSLFEVHVFGPAALVRAVLPHMRERRSGTIIQMSGLEGQVGHPGLSAYSAAKFALEGLSEGLAGEVRPHGIKVLLVEPGSFRIPGPAQGSESAEMDAYTESVGPVRELVRTREGKEPGDPAKAATAVLTALDTEPAPLRLPLGADAVADILGHLDEVRAEVSRWAQTSRGTSFSD
jgi:NAD(P)-dependent dehydrogenase (short-subunit alcohol dehydrogenase family)